MKKILLLLLTILLLSCSPQARLARLVKAHPELVKSDTVKVHDTTFVMGMHTDTIIQAGITHDTVTLYKDKLKIQYFNNGKTVYLAGTVKADTIVKEIPVIVNTVIPAVPYIPPFYWYSTIGLYLLIALELVVLWLLGKKKG